MTAKDGKVGNREGNKTVSDRQFSNDNCKLFK